jgi:hypothetical protein
MYMGIMRTAAVKGLIPPGYKVNELRSNIVRLINETAIVLEEELGEPGLDALSDVFRRLGFQDAKAMKERLRLGKKIADSADAWSIIGNILGSKMRANWTSEDRVEFEHLYCPQYEEFLKTNRIYCEKVCLPYVKAIAEGVSPEVKMEIIKAADEESTCIKAIVKK